jgi:hypothetical protein
MVNIFVENLHNGISVLHLIAQTLLISVFIHYEHTYWVRTVSYCNKQSRRKMSHLMGHRKEGLKKLMFDTVQNQSSKVEMVFDIWKWYRARVAKMNWNKICLVPIECENVAIWKGLLFNSRAPFGDRAFDWKFYHSICMVFNWNPKNFSIETDKNELRIFKSN